MYPRSLCLIFTLLAGMLCCAPRCSAVDAAPPLQTIDAGAPAAPEWRLFHPEKGAWQEGILRLSPNPTAWDRSSAISAAAMDPWAAGGVELRARITLSTTRPGFDRDVSGFLGLTPNTRADTVQAADNMVGLAMDYSRQKRAVRLALVRKEKNGENPNARGSEWGDLDEYPGTARVVASDDGVMDVVLRFRGSRFEASVSPGGYQSSVESGLTPGFWKRALAFAQCGSTADGSGSMTVESAALQGTPRAVLPDEEPDSLRRPPDANQVPEQVTLRAPRQISPDAFSVGGPSSIGEGQATLQSKPFGDLIRQFGGILRFPYGLNISFYFWPYEAHDWIGALGAKGGQYGVIERWYYPNYKNHPDATLSYQTMLAAAKKQGLKLDLLFNVHAFFDGKEFHYVKSLPEEQMRTSNPLERGTFSEETLNRIVANNATLVDYVIKNGYSDTVAFWEMDNERWDMPGREYARCVAAHVRMLRARLPHAKVIVCMAELPAYSRNAEREHGIAWDRDVLAGLKDAGLTEGIDYFAPHIYPYLSEGARDIAADQLQDWAVRNAYRSLDYVGAMIDRAGFHNWSFYVTEWGAQSDALYSQNPYNTSMASAIATAREAMALYSHPRVAGATWHPFIDHSYISRASRSAFGPWGGQTVYLTDTGRIILTPPARAMQMFVAFARGATLLRTRISLPPGVHLLCAKSGGKTQYFAVNATPRPVLLALPGVHRRTSLYAADPAATTLLKEGSYGDNAGDIQEILPQEATDTTLPGYSVNLLR